MTGQPDPQVVNIHGPIISSSDLDRHVALFRALGMEEVGRSSRSVDETTAIWGTTGQALREITLETPGFPFGVRLLGFDPGSDVQIRQPSRGSDSDALKVIDFYAPDLDVARDRIEAAGFPFKPEVAEYETAEGRFREMHLWGPDGVVCALISGDPAFYESFATVRDHIVSEPQSISGPVQDHGATLQFFDTVFGLKVIHRYGLDDDSFRELVGTDNAIKLRAWNVGIKTTEPYFGIIDYGMAAGSQTSLIDVAVPPARGLLGATLRVRDAKAIADRVGTQPVSTYMPGFGDVLVTTCAAPNGGWYQAVQI